MTGLFEGLKYWMAHKEKCGWHKCDNMTTAIYCSESCKQANLEYRHAHNYGSRPEPHSGWCICSDCHKIGDRIRYNFFACRVNEPRELCKTCRVVMEKGGRCKMCGYGAVGAKA